MSAVAPTALAERLAGAGFAFVPGAQMRGQLEQRSPLADWDAFAASWDSLPVDEYMADHGRYRRRRHAVYAIDAAGAIERQPRQPHFQAIDYNPLNGGIERWFEPIAEAVSQGATLQAVLGWTSRLFSALSPGHAWKVEVHQFRIEAVEGQAGQPTPEGMHRDGVDYVLVLLVRRHNIDSGTTMIGNNAEGFFDSFTLTDPFDAALVDDHRVYHGVTPVSAHAAGQPAYRDVLVVTFARIPR
jgi:hypothetical protein